MIEDTVCVRLFAQLSEIFIRHVGRINVAKRGALVIATGYRTVRAIAQTIATVSELFIS